MGKYFRLLRLQDEHFQFGFALASGVYLSSRTGFVLWWAFAVTFISFCAFIVNELTDREDVDRYSWNPVHLKKTDLLDNRIVVAMWLVFAILGLVIAADLGVFFWAVAMLVVGTLYSLKPVRFKSLPVFDILAQLVVWFLVPFLAPIYFFGLVTSQTLLFVLALSLVCWGFFYPYQLADFSADKKAGLAATHVLLGMEKSLLLGFGALLAGLALYFAFGLFEAAPWSIAFVLMGLVLVGFYFYWFCLPSKRREKAMQGAVGMVKPLSWAMVPYLLFWLIR